MAEGESYCVGAGGKEMCEVDYIGDLSYLLQGRVGVCGFLEGSLGCLRGIGGRDDWGGRF